MAKRPRPQPKPSGIEQKAQKAANRAAFDNLKATPQYGGGQQTTSKAVTKKATPRTVPRAASRTSTPTRAPGPTAQQRYERQMRNIKK